MSRIPMDARMVKILVDVAALYDEDPRVVLDRLVGALAGHYSRGAALLAIADGNHLVCAHAAGEAQPFPPGTAIPLDTSSLRLAYIPVRILNLRCDPRFRAYPSLLSAFSRCLAAPICRGRGDVAGALVLFDRGREAFGSEDEPFLQILAARAGAELARLEPSATRPTGSAPSEELATDATSSPSAPSAPVAPAAPGRIYTAGAMTVDTSRRSVTLEGRLVKLTRREYDILAYLAERAGQAVSREDLFEHVWGYDAALAGKVLDVHIGRLRGKIEMDGQTGAPACLIETIRGYGFRLAAW